MAAVISWLMANMGNVILALVAIDSALIPIFPQVGILVWIKNLLSGVAPKQQ